jgi:tetratricopeptide (TPR) repeat protein
MLLSDHSEAAIVLRGLANLYAGQGKDNQAELLFLRVLSIIERHLGSKHLETASTLHDLAVFYHTQSKYSEAENLYQRALSIHKQVLGPDHPDTKETTTRYVILLRELGRQDEADLLESPQSKQGKAEEDQSGNHKGWNALKERCKEGFSPVFSDSHGRSVIRPLKDTQR